ncbi:hypothetical protein KC19_4G193700 [Ceratodon purpureus]|uniref:Peptidyl-prolyl cis-trans isomerase n=1 Tax=Ceratodon purpureus TaxID=3225 RepID=A0A8T0ICT1_CERPU|nr:hypothetical protein KC19_4G193700 [Ceratodon purpureus]
MARMSEAMCKEVIRGETSRMLYPYPEHEKPDPVVILDTTAGDMTLEFHFKESPKTVHNFLELCRCGYYEPCLFNRIQKDLWVQCGDPTSTGRGGESIHGPDFPDEYTSTLKHDKAGVVSMCNKRKPDTNGSQFFITLGPAPWLNGMNTIFGQVVKGLDVLKRMNTIHVNKYDRPLDHVKLTRTLVVERPRHFEWRPHAESYGCLKSKGSQLAEFENSKPLFLRPAKVAPERNSFLKLKRMNARFYMKTSQGGWELWRKRAY